MDAATFVNGGAMVILVGVLVRLWSDLQSGRLVLGRYHDQQVSDLKTALTTATQKYEDLSQQQATTAKEERDRLLATIERLESSRTGSAP